MNGTDGVEVLASLGRALKEGKKRLFALWSIVGPRDGLHPARKCFAYMYLIIFFLIYRYTIFSKDSSWAMGGMLAWPRSKRFLPGLQSPMLSSEEWPALPSVHRGRTGVDACGRQRIYLPGHSRRLEAAWLQVVLTVSRRAKGIELSAMSLGCCVRWWGKGIPRRRCERHGPRAGAMWRQRPTCCWTRRGCSSSS